MRLRKHHLLTHRQAIKLNQPFGALVELELYTEEEIKQGYSGDNAKAVYLNGRFVGGTLSMADDYGFLYDRKRSNTE